MAVDFEEFRKIIRASQFSSVADKLEKEIELSIRLKTTSKAADGVGASRFGGVPDLPAEIDWPTWEGIKTGSKWRKCEGGPLGFLAQINLASLPNVATGLPRSGMLYFFYDIEAQPWGFDPQDRDGHRVIYSSRATESLAPRTAPRNLDGHPFQSVKLEAFAELLLPDIPESVDIAPEDMDAYQSLRDALIGRWGETHHRLLGYPQIIQNDMRSECQLVSNGIYCGDGTADHDPRAAALLRDSADWRLLLQIDSDEDGPGWMWGDAGRLYYWIRRQDLAALNFLKTWLCLQCF